MTVNLTPLVIRLQASAVLSDAERAAVLGLPVVARKIDAGDDIARERESPSQCCLVLEGWLFRYKDLLDGSRQIFSFHIAGDIPDLQSLHLKTMDHNLGAVVRSRVALIEHDAVRKLIGKHPRLGDILWRETLIDAAIFREWMVGMGRKDGPQRIAHLLCEMFVKAKVVGLAQRNAFLFPLTQRMLGDALGLHDVHVNRCLMTLRRLGLIELKGHTLTLPRWEEVQLYADFDPLYLHVGGKNAEAGVPSVSLIPRASA